MKKDNTEATNIAYGSKTGLPAKGLVEVLLLSSSTRAPVFPGTIIVEKDDEEITRHKVDQLGRAVFNLPNGEYRLLVDGSSLSQGFVPPYRQEMDWTEGMERGFHAPVVTVRTRETQVEVYVHEIASVTVQVLDPEGNGIRGLQVVLSTLSNRRGNLSFSEHTDPDGIAQLKNVIPGGYRIQTFFDPYRDYGTDAAGVPYPRLARPYPYLFEIHPGENKRVTLTFGAGKCSVRGRVLDEDGNAFSPGLSVLAYYQRVRGIPEQTEFALNWGDEGASTVTDENGEFSLQLLPAEYGVVIGARNVNPGGLGENDLACWVQQPFIELADDRQTMDLGTLIAYRAKPFTMKGIVVLAPELIGEGIRFSDLDVAVLIPKTLTGEPPAELRVRLGKDGFYEWRCETGGPEPIGVVTLRIKCDRIRGGALIRDIEIVPVANSILEFPPIHFPE